MADQLIAVPLVTPGSYGLNKSQASVPDLDPGWSVELQNMIFDTSGRIAAREGWTKVTSAALAGTPAIRACCELVLAGGTKFVISAANNKLYVGTTTLTDITGSLTVTGNNWQFFTWNSAIYGVQAGHPLIKYTGTGTFTTITAASGTVPSGGTCGMGAFGRLWVLKTDNQTIQYCDLLDDTNWGTVGAGSINVSTVWTRGIDQVINIAAAGSKMVIFGYKQIIIYADQAGAAIGINPQNIYVYDTIEGTGLAARDTVQSTGEGDLTWLSPTGVQSLQRLLSSGKDNPVMPLDPQIRDYFQTYFVNEDPATIRSVYSPSNRFYLILLPNSQRVFCYDTNVKLQDGTLRVSEWPNVTMTAMANAKDGTLYLGQAGVLGIYDSYTDNGATYTVVWNSPNLALKPDYENRRKVLKRIKAVMYFTGTTVLNFYWGTDFGGLNYVSQQTVMGSPSEYNIAQFNINEFSGGALLAVLGFPIDHSGRWIQFGMTATINGAQLAIQQLDAYVKIGNMV